MKYPFYLYLFFSLLILQSCRKYSNKPHVLTRGDGVWQIEQIEYTYYDSLETIDTTITKSDSLGELVFLESHWGTGPIHLAKHIYIDTTGETIISNLDFMTDSKRLDLEGSTPVGVEGLYSVEKWGRNNQKWISTLTDTSYPNGIIYMLKTVTVKKGKS